MMHYRLFAVYYSARGSFRCLQNIDSTAHSSPSCLDRCPQMEILGIYAFYSACSSVRLVICKYFIYFVFDHFPIRLSLFLVAFVWFSCIPPRFSFLNSDTLPVGVRCRWSNFLAFSSLIQTPDRWGFGSGAEGNKDIWEEGLNDLLLRPLPCYAPIKNSTITVLGPPPFYPVII